MSLEYLKTIGKARESLKTIAQSPIQIILDQFITGQIDVMKAELRVRRATGSLAASIIPVPVPGEGSTMTIEILANDYWDFINSGVNGLSRSHGSPYSFKTAFPGRKMIDAFTGTGSLFGWMATKNIKELKYTDKDGKMVVRQLTTPADFRAAAFVFARGVKQHGIKPTPFVDNAFTDESLEELQEKIFQALEAML